MWLFLGILTEEYKLGYVYSIYLIWGGGDDVTNMPSFPYHKYTRQYFNDIIQKVK